MTIKLEYKHTSFPTPCAGKALDLPTRELQDRTDGKLTVHCTPLSGDNGTVFSIKPPHSPERTLQRASCDIVLVIDVSSSMNSAAPLPDLEDETTESAGLSILDLVKHASRSILETLAKDDRLAVVTFSKDATIVHNLTAMTGHNKRRLQRSIENLTDDGCTNLWAGIQAGLQVFNLAGPSSNVQGMYVLTDGMPNHLCPAQGYVPKIKPLLARLADSNGSVPTIHTFGFGYDIRSGLLQSIAEVGLGSYAFIPDAGMIGTVFIHAVANLYSTFATHAVLEIHGPNPDKIQCPTVFNSSVQNSERLILRLGNLQYAQSRDILVQLPPGSNMEWYGATINYTDLLGDQHQAPIVFGADHDNDIDYQVFRSKLCSALAEFFPRRANGEHHPISPNGKYRTTFDSARTAIEDLCIQLRGAAHSPNVQSLIDDLDGEDPAGQISKALISSESQDYWKKWGQHYLPSLLHAHARQVCNSFKDPGPLRYGEESALFKHCREQLDTAFDRLPAPKPSRLEVTTGHIVKNVKMSRYHNSGSACFDGGCLVRLANGLHIPIASLHAGIKVWSPTGSRTVAAVLKTVPAQTSSKDWIVRVGDLWVTPWHPILIDDEWMFPVQVAEQIRPCTLPVYSVLLEQDPNPASHALEVGGQVCVTLGHGILPSRSPKDVRAHSFFGNRKHILLSLDKLPHDHKTHHVASGVRRDPSTGLIKGFMSAASQRSTKGPQPRLNKHSRRHVPAQGKVRLPRD